jgi:hypothetical protein
MSRSISASGPIFSIARALSLLVAGAAAVSAPLTAQTPTRSRDDPAALFTRIPSLSADDADHRPGWIRPLASAVVPGSGQLMSGAPRGAIYLVAEVFLITKYANSRSEAHREQDRYLDLAFEVARSAFAPSQRDTAFEYFEQMTKFVESGPFDVDPTSKRSTGPSGGLPARRSLEILILPRIPRHRNTSRPSSSTEVVLSAQTIGGHGVTTRLSTTPSGRQSAKATMPFREARFKSGWCWRITSSVRSTRSFRSGFQPVDAERT